MKPARLLQLLLLICLVPRLVPGGPRQHFLRYILDPPPCRSYPENCTYFCNLQEDCQGGLQCCAAFCGIVCSLNKAISHQELGDAGAQS
ncbi:PREDICTED: WAP four-disulfide core domain protein 13 [Condylura cristata]|uniref:WAP four-disulfide core domain protein 13 n=1 Tax=Condylura cristata TaxID=143302 RepID=UPI0003343100|nr:PREDICTED: WAP four-disulfide core domain protein 13 [Condylura cristata]